MVNERVHLGVLAGYGGEKNTDNNYLYIRLNGGINGAIIV